MTLMDRLRLCQLCHKRCDLKSVTISDNSYWYENDDGALTHNSCMLRIDALERFTEPPHRTLADLTEEFGA